LEDKLKRLILLVLPIVLLAQDSTKKETKAASKSTGMTVPADAVKIGPYAWRYVDNDGKTWIYRYTITGLAKVPDTGVDATYTGVKVIDKGETVRFERPAVMGVSVWERKKSELTGEEKAMIEFANSRTGQGKVAGDKSGERK
jgi:hypothetical protein